MTAPFEAYAALICDLDGVVYRGQAAVPHAVEALSAQRRPVLYATNNAARTPDVVAAHLRELGLAVEASDEPSYVEVEVVPGGTDRLSYGIFQLDALTLTLE